MPRDYARSNHRNLKRKANQSRRKPKSSRRSQRNTGKQSKTRSLAFSAAWLVMGLFLALFIMSLFYLNSHMHKSKHAKQNIQQSIPQKQADQHAIKTTNKPPQPHFDFYTILPKTQPQAIATQPQPEAPKSVAQQKTITKTKYVLQVASFHKYDDAEKLMLKLKSQGYHTFTSKVTKKQSQWFRVNVGPFTILSKAENVQDLLRRQHINSLLLKSSSHS